MVIAGVIGAERRVPDTRRRWCGSAGRGRVVLLAAALFAACTAGAQARGLREEKSLDELIGGRVRVIGTVELYGSEPHTFLGLLADPERNRNLAYRSRIWVPLDEELLFALEGDQLEELTALQGATVEVRGTLVRVSFGPGFPAIIRVESYRTVR